MTRRGHGDQLTDLLELQHGVISVEQALQRGVSYAAIIAHLSAHRWQRRGVFAAFTGPVPFALDGLADETGELLDLTVDRTRRIAGRMDGIRLRYRERLAAIRHPVRIPPRTRIEETVLDLVADAQSVDEVATWVTRACQRRLATPRRIGEALSRRNKIRWRAVVDAMVADVAQGALSPLEVAYLRHVERAHGLPTGARNRRWVDTRVRWIDVDLDEFGVRVELDGRIGHMEEGRFRDRRRDNRSTVQGSVTLRYGHAEVATVLKARGWSGEVRRCGRSCRASS